MFDSNQAYLVSTKGRIGRADASTAQQAFDRVMREFPEAAVSQKKCGDVSVVLRTVGEYGPCKVFLFSASVIKPGDWYARPNAGRY